MTGITAEQARAIRKADTLCFDHDPDGNGWIRAITRGVDYAHEITITVPVEMSRVQNYGPGHYGPWSCFDMIMSAQYDDRAQTMTRRIKAGTRLALVWTRDNSSLLTKEAGVVVDMLDLKVQNGNVCDTYRVRTFVGYDNASRLVRRA